MVPEAPDHQHQQRLFISFGAVMLLVFGGWLLWTSLQEVSQPQDNRFYAEEPDRSVEISLGDITPVFSEDATQSAAVYQADVLLNTHGNPVDGVQVVGTVSNIQPAVATASGAVLSEMEEVIASVAPLSETQAKFTFVYFKPPDTAAGFTSDQPLPIGRLLFSPASGAAMSIDLDAQKTLVTNEAHDLELTIEQRQTTPFGYQQPTNYVVE